MGLNIWRFVDSPTPAPAVLLDMNDGAQWKTLGGDNFKLPTPPLKRSLATNNMTDGAVLTSAAYDMRTLAFTLDLQAATDTGRIAQLDALKAQLSRPSNLIMHQISDAPYPVFFRTVRSDDYVVDTEISDLFWRVSCTVMAEPFAIGVRRDIPTVTVTNDPASGAAPTLFDLTGIAGDAPTPAFVRLQGLGAGGTAILAQRTGNNPTALTVVAQLESATLGTDGHIWSDVSMSGGSGIYSDFSSNANLMTRVTATVPTATSSEALRGRYRVILRVHSGGTSADFVVRYVQNASGDSINGPQVSWHANQTWQFLDLGIIEFPAFQTPAALGYSGLTPGLGSGTISIQASRANGLDNLDMDYLYLVPADERMCTVGQTAATGYLVLDGPNDSTYGMAAGSSPFASTIAGRVIDNAGGLTPRFGGLPQLVPNTTNRWYLLVDKQGITTTTTVDVSYWPRWREVATS